MQKPGLLSRLILPADVADFLQFVNTVFPKKLSITAGIVASDGQDSIGWELPTGLGLLIAAYIYDRYIKFDK